jgi:hypothetical protein
LEKKRKKAEYARQYRLRQKLEKELQASNATLKGDGSDSLKRKLELEMQTAIDEEKVLEKKRKYNRHAQHCNV